MPTALMRTSIFGLRTVSSYQKCSLRRPSCPDNRIAVRQVGYGSSKLLLVHDLDILVRDTSRRLQAGWQDPVPKHLLQLHVRVQPCRVHHGHGPQDGAADLPQHQRVPADGRDPAGPQVHVRSVHLHRHPGQLRVRPHLSAPPGTACLDNHSFIRPECSRPSARSSLVCLLARAHVRANAGGHTLHCVMGLWAVRSVQPMSARPQRAVDALLLCQTAAHSCWNACPSCALLTAQCSTHIASACRAPLQHDPLTGMQQPQHRRTAGLLSVQLEASMPACEPGQQVHQAACTALLLLLLLMMMRTDAGARAL